MERSRRHFDRRTRCRERQHEGTPGLAWFGPEPTSIGLDEAASNRKPEARAAFFAVLEGLEDAIDVGRAEPGSAVEDPY